MFAGMLVAGFAMAQQAAPTIPAPLEPWRDWVLADQGHLRCPLLANAAGTREADRVCAWPSTLRLDVESSGAQFRQSWSVDAPGWIPLPGEAGGWPQAVTGNGRALPVTARDGHPVVWLEPGTTELRGRLRWEQAPQAVRVPGIVGVIDLHIDGRPVRPVERDGEQVTLGSPGREADEADALEVRVYRRLQDSIPMLLETRLELAGAGQVREQEFGRILPEGFVAMRLHSDWPARIDADGGLRIQVQPDVGELVLLARAETTIDGVRAPSIEDWPAQEVWSYQAAPHLRMTRVEGPLALDPRRAGVPGEWLELPAFALSAGESLAIDERQRGPDTQAGNRLRLDRTIWLDHDGGGWTLRDRIGGTLVRDWRLDALPPLHLQQASRARDEESLLITLAPAGDHRGVEWRTPGVDLRAGLRSEASGAALPVGGWNQDFESVHTTLRLPAGYRLLAAPGADRGSDSWVSRWTLLDVFLLALVALLAWHAAGLAGSIAASGYLLLSYGEPGAPLYTLIALLAVVLAARALPSGRLSRSLGGSRWVVLVVVALLALPWAAQQARWALFPQLAPPAQHLARATMADQFHEYGRARSAPVALEMAPPASPPPPPAAARRSGETLDRIEVTGSRIKRADLMEGYGQSTLVQTGPGMPSWEHGSLHRLSWSGPVRSEETWRPWISPPWLSGTWRLLAIALLALTLWLLLRPRPQPGRSGTAPSRASAPGSAALAIPLVVAMATLVGPAFPAAAQSSIPPDTMLDELQQRLVQPPVCAPHCLAIPSATVEVGADRAEVSLDVHAQAAVAVAIPTDRDGAAPLSVRVDGETARGILAHRGQLVVPVGRGVHRVVIEYAASGDRLALVFAERPEHLSVIGAGWQAGGLSDGRLPSGTLTLGRDAARADDDPDASLPASAAEQFPPYVRIVRTLVLDRLWSVEGQVVRLAPERGGMDVRVPVLDGERVSGAGLRRVGGHLELSFDADQDEVRWRSELDRQSTLSLHAPSLAEHAEEWRVVVGPTWRVEFSGVPESLPAGGGHDPGDIREFVFHPLPGETLRLDVAEPDVAPGALLAIDRVVLDARQGERSADYSLRLGMRSSQGGEHRIRLPADAVLLGVQRARENLALRLQDGHLALPLLPGHQEFAIRFRLEEPIGPMTALPEGLDLHAPAANIDLSLSVPDTRWLLLAWGPRQGAAVLYWGELIVVLVLAVALGRSRLTRVRIHQWVLLALGFSTVSWAALLLVAAWLVALSWRERTDRERLGAWFNWVQIGLVLLTGLAIVVLIRTVPYGLLGQPDMHIAGGGSSADVLRWFLDRSDGPLPGAGTLSVPLWAYRLLMLAWAIWLATAVVGWLRGGFSAWAQGGYWRPWRRKRTQE